MPVPDAPAARLLIFGVAFSSSLPATNVKRFRKAAIATNRGCVRRDDALTRRARALTNPPDLIFETAASVLHLAPLAGRGRELPAARLRCPAASG